MAIGDGITWDESNPTNDTDASLEDDYNRDLRKGIRARMAIEHEFPASQSATSQAGAHKFITLQTQTGIPVLAGTQVGVVYSKLATTNYELFFARTGSNAGEVQITVGTGINTPGISFDGVTINTNTAGALIVASSGVGTAQLSGFASSYSSNGYIGLPGLAIQWGQAAGSTDGTVSFPISFSTACFQVMVCGADTQDSFYGASSITPSSFFLHRSPAATHPARWIAIGH